MRQYSAPSPSRYDPVIINSQASNNSDTVANMKEYETQVLAMAVPPDGDDDLQIDFSAKNHAFSLDNVSYITHKENNGQSSPSHSDATTATINTLRRTNNNLNNLNNNNNNNINLTMNNRQNTFNRNNANPLASPANGSVPGTLTLGRIKHPNSNHYQNGGYKVDTISRNNLNNMQNNAYSTMGRRGNTYNGGVAVSDNLTDLLNTLSRNNQANNRIYGSEVPITNPLFKR